MEVISLIESMQQQKSRIKQKTTVLAAPFSIRRNGRLINKFDRACRESNALAD
jgi:hypothetical protein